MSAKYELAVKYYVETSNEQQLQMAYNELEVFNQSYENFKLCINLLSESDELVKQCKPNGK